MFHLREETTFVSSYREFRKVEGSRNRYCTSFNYIQRVCGGQLLIDFQTRLENRDLGCR